MEIVEDLAEAFIVHAQVLTKLDSRERSRRRLQQINESVVEGGDLLGIVWARAIRNDFQVCGGTVGA